MKKTLVIVSIFLSNCATTSSSSEESEVASSREKSSAGSTLGKPKVMKKGQHSLERINQICKGNFQVRTTPNTLTEHSAEIGVSVPVKDPKSSHPFVKYRCIAPE